MKINNLFILVASYSLKKIGGTESWTYTIAEELKSRGHSVDYYTFEKGLTSSKLEAIGVPCMRRKRYDLIIANHFPVVSKLLNKGFIIQTSHGIFSSLEIPNSYADAHVAISHEIIKKFLTDKLNAVLIPNGINLTRFSCREPIRTKIKKVLSLSHSVSLNARLLTLCRDLGIELQMINKFDNPIWDIENYINNADLVIGLGRSVYDAMACGRAVIVLDSRGYMADSADGYIDASNIELSISNNCSGRAYNLPITDVAIKNYLEKYKSTDGAFLRKFAEENFNIKDSVDKYLMLYFDRRKVVYSKKRYLKNIVAKARFFALGKKYKIFTFFYNILKTAE